MFSFRTAVGLVTGLVLWSHAADAVSVSSTILILARDALSANSATSGLQAYGIPYQVVVVPQAGILLPTLNSSATQGNYGGIVVQSEVAYSYPAGWSSALTAAQWQTLYNYQTSFGVRMVRLDAFPSVELGVTTAGVDAGCCSAGVEQLVAITDASAFPTANIKTGASVSTQGLWHYPATIVNATIARPFASFAPDASGRFTTTTTAGIFNNLNGRQQMVWFMTWDSDWSQSVNYLQHAFIHWITRGIFVGKRKVYLSAQVDDMHLETELYSPASSAFRVRPTDLDAHRTWQTNINTRLPAGSNFFVEIGHNGNGDIENATAMLGSTTCIPDYGVEYESPPTTALEFMKPLGTGTDLWPREFSTYNWSMTCARLDPVASWFNLNPNVFAAVSHTFSHEELNNATYRDASLEISFNVAWLRQIGLASSTRFSPAGLIPPAITGLHNGDAIRAWMDNGIRNVVGDNTRPALRNPSNSFWPRITTVADNGYAGLTIIPRWATTIYYNCDTAACTLAEWIDTSGGSGDFNALLTDARTTNTRYLLGLHPDPYMFHQANMRQGDVNTITIGTQTGRFSLLTIWTEVIAQEMIRLTNWPILSLKHDDLAALFVNRQTLDGCNPNLVYTLSNDGRSIVGGTVTTNGNACSVPVPFTVPGTATTSSPSTRDQIGSEPAIYWTTMSGSSVSFTLGTPVAV